MRFRLSAAAWLLAVGLPWTATANAAVTEPPSPDVGVPTKLQLVVGELRPIAVREVVRVAIGNPEVADVTIVSDAELLLQAKQAGTTSLVIWDREGQRRTELTVVDQTMEDVAEQLRRLLRQLGFDRVSVKQETTRVVLDGEVGSQEDYDRLEQLLAGFPKVTNLVLVPPTPPPPLAPPPQMVRLSVQVIELDRNFTEKLGVKWSEGIGFTEQSFAVGPSGTIKTDEAISDLGISNVQRIGEAFRIGRLFRSGFTSTINFLVSKGKARILAEPTLVTASGKQATSFMGQQVPVVSATTVGVTTGGVSATIEFKEVGVKLTMTPTVLEAHDKIGTALNAEVSFIDNSVAIEVATGTKTVKVPGFKTRKAATEIVTDSGETIVIAGLLQLEDSHAVDQVPGVGSMPVVGRLFRSPEIKTKRTELVLAVTPELAGRGEETEERSVMIEQALASAELSALEDPRIRYALQIQDRIAQSLRYPAREHVLAVDGTVKLTLHLLADGSLGRAMVTESSGIEALDAAALNAAQLQAPYPAFPPSIVERELWLELPVIFRPS